MDRGANLRPTFLGFHVSVHNCSGGGRMSGRAQRTVVRIGAKLWKLLGFTLIELLVVIAIIGVLIAVLLPAVQQARESARRTQCRNNLHQIGLALHNYHNAMKTFPQSHQCGRSCEESGIPCVGTKSHFPGFAFRVSILPFLDQEPIYNQFNFDGGRYNYGNGDPMIICQSPISVYLCPSDATPTAIPFTGTGWTFLGGNLSGYTSNTPYGTNYAALNSISGHRREIDEKNFLTRGGFAVQGLKSADYLDGMSNTVMVAEKFRGRKFTNMRCDETTQWTTTGWKVCSPSTSEDLSGFECSVWGYEASWCGADASRTPNSKENDDISWADAHNAAPGHMPASSAHSGGVFTLFADGGVHFVTDGVDLTVWKNTCSFAGGETDVLQVAD